MPRRRTAEGGKSGSMTEPRNRTVILFVGSYTIGGICAIMIALVIAKTLHSPWLLILAVPITIVLAQTLLCWFKTSSGRR